MSDEEIIVKVVRGDYEEDVHYAVAEPSFAPKLYGVAKVDGVPPHMPWNFFPKNKARCHFNALTRRH
jgi:hypothetical protein